ncbi:type II toxin-antitoxin system RelE family toxin [Acidithiobacillus sp.]|uniref:type II toxin-antitoxin system RelE family toxin n=1 Tax=Acidithiobacillus sp. TaxID=1872118 RepID=UPI003CFD949F
MRRLELTRDALKFLDGLPPKQFKQVAASMLDLLRNPEPHDSRPLKGHSYRRVDIGEYRIVYDLPEDVVRVLLIGKRNDDAVYKDPARK